MIDILKRLLRMEPTAQHLPNLFDKAVERTTPAPPTKTGPVLVDRARRMWEFPDLKRAERTADVEELTVDEANALNAAGYRNQALNQRVKDLRRAGKTGKKIASELSVSPDYIKKIGGVLSRFEVQSGAN